MTKLKTMVVILSVVSLLAFATKASIAEQSTYTPQEMTAEEMAEDYIKMFSETYGADEEELLKVAYCESKMGKNKIGDSGNAIGLFQYWNDTWNWFSGLKGEELDINSNFDQAKLTAFIFANYPEYKRHWTTWVAIQKGGSYSFYSNKLGKHFTIYCR